MMIHYTNSDFDRKRFHVLAHEGPYIAGFDLFCDALIFALLLSGLRDINDVSLYDTVKRKSVDIDFYYDAIKLWDEDEKEEIESEGWDYSYQKEWVKFVGLNDAGDLPM